MFLSVIMLVVGFVLLIKGADFFVDASVGIAQKLRIPSTIVGLTIVSLGTSAPEAVVSITASLAGSNELAVGNIVGSNLFNLLFIIGICAVIKPFAVNFGEISRDFIISILAAILLFLVIFLGGELIPRWVSLLLFGLFLFYIGFLIVQALKNRVDEEKSDVLPRKMWLNLLLIGLGLAGIVFGGQLTVTGAVDIAHAMGMSERIVGLTIVAIGTSLPELMTSVVASKKGETGIALGNVVGSNIFNILGILGIAGLISPLAVDAALVQDIIVLIAGSLLALAFVFTGRRISRAEGVIMSVIYLAYMGWIIYA
ncbi:MAG: calcium/sodium antiporter [Turicibacter sp.]|nr:calcium/sodium antiporter [Turicibacter sp.]